MRRPLSIVLVALCGVMAGCSALPGIGGDNDASGGSEFSAEGATFRGALDALPVMAVDNDVAMFITYGNWQEMAGVAGLAPLRASDADEFVQRVLLRRPPSEGGIGAAVTPPEPIFGALQLGELEASFGFGLADMTATIEASAPPDRFMVMVGPAGWGGPVESVGGGGSTYGQGNDFEVNLEDRAAGRQLGRPLRVAELDGVLAASLSSSQIANWQGGAASYGELPAMAEIADSLNDSYFVVLLKSSTNQMPQAVITERFDLIAVGSRQVEGVAHEKIVYHFGNEAAAERALPSVVLAWEGTVDGGVAISELVTVVGVEQIGAVVVVDTRTGDRPSGVGIAALQRRDLVAVHQ